MADEQEPDPFERYFRPGGPGSSPAGGGSASGGPGGAGGYGAAGGYGQDAAGGPGPVADAGGGEVDGVLIGQVPAPRVPVGGRRRKDGPGAGRRGLGEARRQRRSVMVSGIVSSFVLLTSGGAWAFESYVTGSVGQADIAGLGTSTGVGPKGAMNILIAGVDRREGLTRAQQAQMHTGHDPGARSDTMMLVHLSADHRRVSVVSLPRDSYVLIPAHRSNGDEGAKGAAVPARYGKLTWAYEFGGPDLTVATVKKITGLSIDHYIEVNFFGFVKMVDAIGGVDICTPQPINDAKSGLRLPAGKSHVGGIEALAYARARYALGDGSDLGRIDRQQRFLATMMHTALGAGTLTDPFKLQGFLRASLDSLTVDRGLAKDAPALADQMRGMSTDNVSFVKIPLTDSDYRTVLWNSPLIQSTVQWDQQRAAEIFRSISRDQPLVKPAGTASAGAALGSGPGNLQARTPKAGDLTVPPGEITVRVRNGVGTTGLARKAAADLKKVGFGTVVVPGIAETGLVTTVIQYGHGKADSARTLAAALPGAKLKEQDALGTTIQVIVGSDWSGAQKVTVSAPSIGVAGGVAGGASGTGGGAQHPATETRTATQNVLCK